MIQEKGKLEDKLQRSLDERKRLEEEIQPLEAKMKRILEPVPTVKSYFQIRDMEESGEPPFGTLVWEEDPLTGELVPETLLLERKFGEAEKLAEPEVERLRATINGKQFVLSRLDNEIKVIFVKAAIEGITLSDESAASSAAPRSEESEKRNPRGAGRPPVPDVAWRRQKMFEFLREQGITNKEDAAKHIRQMDFRERLYDYFDEQKVEMIESEDYSEIRKWADLKGTADDLQATDSLIKDMRRNWDRLWNSQG